MLDIRGLTFSRPGGQVFSYELSVAADSILAVQGPSGVGKTTLLDLIAGFETPQTGTISWQGTDFTNLPPWDRPVTTVFQSDNLFAHLNCRQNVEIGLNPKTPVAPNVVDEAFRRVGIDGLQGRLPSEISGGQQQRVALVRALLRDQPVLLLDESFSALDWQLRCDCFDALRDIGHSRGMAVVLVSHDMRDAEYLQCQTLTLHA